MKRSCSMRDAKADSTNMPQQHNQSSNKPPPSKRSADFDAELNLEAMSMNGASNGHVEKMGDGGERVAVLDFGAQYGKVIDRRVRELRVQSEMFPLNTTAKQLKDLGGFKAIIISGGPSSVYAPDAPQIDPEIFTCGLPVFGICYGFQLLNKLNGGRVSREQIREDGQCHIAINTNVALFEGLSATEQVLLTHGDSVVEATVAPGFEMIAKSGSHVAGIADEKRRLYGVQFHPEVDLTTNGVKMFENFLFKIAGCSGKFTMKSREQSCIDEIVQTVGDKKVLVMVSGGVDSTVCAALLNKALGADRVTAVHIDNGFMRYKESDAVEKSLADVNLHVKRYNFGNTFRTSTEKQSKTEENTKTLDAACEPELKRKIIGNTFIRVKDIVMNQLNLNQNDYFFAQGTLRPDLIESASLLASGHADTIKTHHNDTELVRELRKLGRVIEPLKDFHKDEVRELGKDLGLPEHIVQRHPFPGPGLAIRILCAEQEYRCADFEETERNLFSVCNTFFDNRPENRKLNQFIRNAASEQEWRAIVGDQICMIQTTLLPIKTVGVQGDKRSYSYVAALSTPQQPIPWTALFHYAQLIPKLLHNINRVAYVFGDPVKYSVRNVTLTHLVPPTIEKLQMADKAATDVLFGRGSAGLPDVGHLIQQMPVVMIPVDFDRCEKLPASFKHSFVLRPFITSDFMTGIAAQPGKHIPEQTILEMERAIRRTVPGVSRVLLDMTSKPPGTTEWE